MADKLPVKIFTAWNQKKLRELGQNIPETNHLGSASTVISSTGMLKTVITKSAMAMFIKK